tara:strand:- start:284 stop:508 length:225 start_codon:yes stop_codon:yes gene_type:complete
MFTPRHSTPTSIEAPELGQEPGIHAFAANGLASAGMLQATYLRFIEEEATAKRIRSKIKPGSWSVQKRISLKDE